MSFLACRAPAVGVNARLGSRDTFVTRNVTVLGALPVHDAFANRAENLKGSWDWGRRVWRERNCLVSAVVTQEQDVADQSPVDQAQRAPDSVRNPPRALRPAVAVGLGQGGFSKCCAPGWWWLGFRRWRDWVELLNRMVGLGLEPRVATARSGRAAV